MSPQEIELRMKMVNAKLVLPSEPLQQITQPDVVVAPTFAMALEIAMAKEKN